MLLRARSAGRDTSCLSSLCLALAQLRREGVEAGRVVLREVGGRRGGGVEGDTDIQDGLLSTGPTPSSLSLVYACRGQY